MDQIDVSREDDIQSLLAMVQFEIDCRLAVSQHQCGEFIPTPAPNWDNWDAVSQPEWSHLGF